MIIFRRVLWLLLLLLFTATVIAIAIVMVPVILTIIVVIITTCVDYHCYFYYEKFVTIVSPTITTNIVMSQNY